MAKGKWAVQHRVPCCGHVSNVGGRRRAPPVCGMPNVTHKISAPGGTRLDQHRDDHPQPRLSTNDGEAAGEPATVGRRAPT
jgi:hypothetical protein